MKRLPLFFITLFLFGTAFSQTKQAPDSTDIRWYTMREAQNLAETEDKKVLVYLEASWCTYCKRMENEVFPRQEIQQALHEYYYPVRVDIESDSLVQFNGKNMTGRRFAGTMRISGTPTFLFVGGQGEILGSQPGYLSPDVFKALLTFVGTDTHTEMEFKEYLKDESDK